MTWSSNSVALLHLHLKRCLSMTSSINGITICQYCPKKVRTYGLTHQDGHTLFDNVMCWPTQFPGNVSSLNTFAPPRQNVFGRCHPSRVVLWNTRPFLGWSDVPNRHVLDQEQRQNLVTVLWFDPIQKTPDFGIQFILAPSHPQNQLGTVFSQYGHVIDSQSLKQR